MTIKVAINGYGRIGRTVLRAHYEGGKKHDIQIVAINDLGKPETNAHLTKYDTAHGPFPGSVSVDGDFMVVNGDKIRVLANRNPADLPWKDLGVDVVMECTGFFTTKTGAASAVGLVMPELNGRLDGYAMRVPVINVSIVDLSFIAARDTSVDEINAIMKAASTSGPLAGLLAYSDGPLVSVDFNHNPASSTYDATLTKVSGRLVKVSSWYDNEWGFSNRMLDTTIALMAAK